MQNNAERAKRVYPDQPWQCLAAKEDGLPVSLHLAMQGLVAWFVDKLKAFEG